MTKVSTSPLASETFFAAPFEEELLKAFSRRGASMSVLRGASAALIAKHATAQIMGRK
jgi:hypothetical protein